MDPETRAQRHHEMAFEGLPDGTFVLWDERPWLVLGDQLLEWTPAGYVAERRARPPRAWRWCSRRLRWWTWCGRDGTPATVPFLHPTARSAAPVS